MVTITLIMITAAHHTKQKKNYNDNGKVTTAATIANYHCFRILNENGRIQFHVNLVHRVRPVEIKKHGVNESLKIGFRIGRTKSLTRPCGRALRIRSKLTPAD